MMVETQKARVNHLLELIKENPELQIMPMVDSELVCGDEYGWWVGGWGEAVVDEYYEGDGRIFLKSQDFDKLVEDLWDNNIDMSKEEVEEIVNGRDWQKAIFVKITLP